MPAKMGGEVAILITGGSGFLGSALTPRLLEKGHRVYSLSRHPPAAAENLIPLLGDITEPNLGLLAVPQDLHAVYHLAAIHRLSEDNDGSIWETNVGGTENVLDFCARCDIPHLYFCSTAYTEGRNTYERSKATCELMVKESEIGATIFKPAIIMGTPQHFYPGHFSQFVGLLVRIMQREEPMRKKIEGTLSLPPIQPSLRIKGNPKGKINLVQIDPVADAIANIEREDTFWLTHPDPPTLEQVFNWIGEFIMLRIKVEPKFKPKPIEEMFRKLVTPFEPYLKGDNFPSNLKDCPPITKEFIEATIMRTIFD